MGYDPDALAYISSDVYLGFLDRLFPSSSWASLNRALYDDTRLSTHRSSWTELGRVPPSNRKVMG